MSDLSAFSKARSRSSSAPCRWGLLGAARIARQLIPAIVTYQDVIEAELDAIYNPLPNDLHLPWTLAALRAGKHALTEKPFMLNAAGARRSGWSFCGLTPP